MRDPKALSNVAKFHQLFNHPILSSPKIPAAKRCALRVELLQEELNELQQAIIDKDMVEVADALCDLQYVLAGAVLEFGLQDQFAELFDEVQRSNMSKACENLEEAKATIEYYAKLGTEAYYKEEDGMYLIYRQEDNKTLKSVHYSPANLKGILSN
jgi:predicted HAD superfamily Cof-like phosphohydrolase